METLSKTYSLTHWLLLFSWCWCTPGLIRCCSKFGYSFVVVIKDYFFPILFLVALQRLVEFLLLVGLITFSSVDECEIFFVNLLLTWANKIIIFFFWTIFTILWLSAAVSYFREMIVVIFSLFFSYLFEILDGLS